jgi:hypothetical protein
LRAYQWNLVFGIVWSFTATIQLGLHSFNVGVALVAGVGGFGAGVVSARGTAGRIEKNGGAYRASRRRTLFLVGLALALGALLFYLIFSAALSLNTLLRFYSLYVGIPALYFGIAVGFRMSEARNGKEILWEGRTWYSVPKGLSWQEKYQYRAEQWYRLRIMNSGEKEASSKV